MARGFFREGKHYSIYEISENLGEKTEETKRLADSLKRYGILKAVRKSAPEFEDLSDHDIVLTCPSENRRDVKYVFDFVGVIVLGHHVFKCYPKYISASEPVSQLKKVLKVIRKYGVREELIYSHSGEGDAFSFNRLLLFLHLMEDYFINGIYTNSQEITERNAEGEILWDRTINETIALIRKGRPYYTEVLTQSMADNETYYFRRLHQCILSKCSAELQELGILDLFDMEEIRLTESDIEDFGDRDYILYRLQQEMEIQFITWKQNLLKALYAYIENGRSDKNDESFGVYGTNSFHLVWEKVCAANFGNMLNEKIENLPMGVSERYRKRKSDTLLSIIERPIWHGTDPEIYDGKVRTLKPDTVRIYPYNEKGDYCFGIFDAKYYCIEFIRGKSGWKVARQPGVGDVTKQYLYQMAFDDFITSQGYRQVRNVFLIPREEAAPAYGYVEMGMLHTVGSKQLENILLTGLCAEKMYDYYLADRQLENIVEIIERSR